MTSSINQSTNNSANKRWIAETLFDDLGFRMTFEVDKVLYELQTEHQHLVLFEHRFFGKMLMLDGATQIVQALLVDPLVHDVQTLASINEIIRDGLK